MHRDTVQVGICGSNSRLVVDEDDNGKFRLERVEPALNHQDTSQRHIASLKNDLISYTWGF